VKAPGVKVKYASSNAKVLVVDAAGRITAKAKGSASLIVKAGSYRKTVKLKVS
jgi:uncharacterized protein YjdB